ncbi:hypothetical protein EDD86DRAFT_142097 [Gorgonomyces haynaldii]|nr:hypothetical protein EDD86DRAFT_142097 [Gorgonomyces haynaldii]
MIPGSSNDWAFENIAANTEATLRKELEEQLEDELKKRQALSKASSGEKRRSRDLLSLVNQSKDLEVEILSTDRVIAKLKEGIEILDSGDRRKIAELIQKTTESSKKQDSKGHFFSQRQYFKPTDCAVCHESLFESKNQGLECASCKIICHKHCQNHIDMTCALQSKLKSVPPMYIMAKDAVDRARWLIGLNTLRREYEVKTFGSSSLDLKRTSSISERSLTTSSKRNS